MIAKINENGATLQKFFPGATPEEDKTENVQYYWYDTTTMPAGWYDTYGKPMTKDGGSLWGDASDIEFTNGNGFRLQFFEFYNDDDEDEENPLPLNIVFNGEVVQGDPEVAYAPGDMKAAGNLLPVEIKLSDISVTGYTDKDGNYLKGWGINSGIRKAAVIAKINENGATLQKFFPGATPEEDKTENVQYYWYDTTTLLAGWYDTYGKPMTKDGGSLWGDAADIKFGAADGFRVQINEFYNDDDEDEENPLPMNIKLPGCL